MRQQNVILFFLCSLFLSLITSCNSDDSEPLPEVIADFDVSATEVLVGQTVIFTDASTGEPTLFQWNFPGGSPETSTEDGVEVSYSTAGTYSVSLTASNAENSDEITKQNIITVYDEITALLESDDTIIVRGQNVEFISKSVGNIDSYSWMFEGGSPQTSTNENPVVQYLDLGSFDVSLEVNGFGEGATLLVEDHIVVLDSVEAQFVSNSGSFTLVEGGQILFNQTSTGNPSNYMWEFEGGTPATSTEENPTVQYDAPGNYDVKLIVSHEAHADTLEIVDLIDVREALAANFTSDVTSIAEGGTISFTDESDGTPTSWLWEFEGGTPSTSTDQNPVVTYSSLGAYDVKLTVTNSFGSAERTEVGYVKVTGLVANFRFDSDLVDETGIGNWSYSNILNPNPTFGQDRSGDPSPAAALQFDIANINSAADRKITNEVTVSVWVNTTLSGTQFHAILDKYDGANDYGFIMAMNNGKVYFRGRDKSGSFRDSGPSVSSVNDGNWHHIVGVMTSNSTWQVWIDGVKEAEQANNFSVPSISNDIPMRLGSSLTSAQNYRGLYDDLKIYNKPLSEAEIQALFNE